ncbi:YaaL family protein [Alteribacillus sp. YIM 98480]|uniref:YaaL family protein n=1 Tax=Alteribacillus sp. YIM 98480 TaxID=2606599 RepID=UPI00131BDC01|nr:YaaL family protein [Alteribacillus sp. YIM 98480]
MLFRKKTIRKAENERLAQIIYAVKQELDRYEYIVANSVEPSQEIQADLKKKRAKYMFLLKEARYRKLNSEQNM